MADSLAKARNTENTKSARAKAQRHGGYGKNIIRRVTRAGRDWEYHATKGWRNYRSVK